METETTTVKLKNGTEEHGPLVSITMISLRGLMEAGMGVGLYELAELCKDNNHKLFGSTGDTLAKLNLVGLGGGKFTVHDSIRNIVLSAIEGEGLDMQLVNPIAE